MIIQLLSNLGTSFTLGLLTPLTAVCVLPLYPGFLVYLANNIKGQKNQRKAMILFGIVIVLGTVSFMTALGVLFSFLLEISLTQVIGIISPIAFGVLVIISIFLIFNFDIGKYLPSSKVPRFKNPFLSAFFFGVFFGAIVVPCNPLFIAALFARGLSVSGFSLSILNFLFFGLGMGAPLLLFSALSVTYSRKIIALLLKYKRVINRGAGIFMLGVALYYLIFVF